MRCSAVICREVSDLDAVRNQLPPGSVDLVFVPGALRQDPALPRTDPPPYVHDIARLALATQAFVVHTNWPNALNRPEEGVEGGGSTVAAPDGEILFRLPLRHSRRSAPQCPQERQWNGEQTARKRRANGEQAASKRRANGGQPGGQPGADRTPTPSPAPPPDPAGRPS